MNFRVVVYDQYGQTGSSSVTESCNIDKSYFNGNYKYSIYKCTPTGRQFDLMIKDCTQAISACSNITGPNCSASCSRVCESACKGGSYTSSCQTCASSYDGSYQTCIRDCSASAATAKNSCIANYACRI